LALDRIFLMELFVCIWALCNRKPNWFWCLCTKFIFSLFKSLFFHFGTTKYKKFLFSITLKPNSR